MDNNKDLGSIRGGIYLMVKWICSGIKDLCKYLQKHYQHLSSIHVWKRYVQKIETGILNFWKSYLQKFEKVIKQMLEKVCSKV